MQELSFSTSDFSKKGPDLSSIESKTDQIQRVQDSFCSQNFY